MAYENKPSYCTQLWDMLSMHTRRMLGSACCTICAMIGVPIFAMLSFFYIDLVAKTKSYPNFNLERLKHPVYISAPLNPATDKFEATFETSINQQQEFESFM